MAETAGRIVPHTGSHTNREPVLFTPQGGEAVGKGDTSHFGVGQNEKVTPPISVWGRKWEVSPFSSAEGWRYFPRMQ